MVRPFVPFAAALLLAGSAFAQEPPPPPMEDVLYWAKDTFGLKPVVSGYHVTFAGLEEDRTTDDEQNDRMQGQRRG